MQQEKTIQTTKIKRKIAMTRQSDLTAQAQQILPAWFVPHMMRNRQRAWFGLLMVGGIIIHITRILRVRTDSSGAVWLDVLLDQAVESENLPFKNFGAQSTTAEASINAGHVMAAFDFFDS
ncbi:MAG: hypothetical protein HQL87_10790 [Magnetococcales bacterium]|nr:hypothetical protein [Magnetococcales bacterium]